MEGEHTYSVYRAGRDEPVRRVSCGPGAGVAAATTPPSPIAPPGLAFAGAGAPSSDAPLSPSSGMPDPSAPGAPAVPLAALARRRRERPRRARSAVSWALGLGALLAGGVLFWLYGRQPLSDFWAVLDLAEATGEIPRWLLVGAPLVALAVAAVVTSYLAFGHHLALKVIGLLVVTIVLLAPGFALGWTNGTLGEMGDRSVEVTERVKHARTKLQPPLPGEAVNVLLIGADVRPDDPGRADTLVLVRLDPETKSITMLSFPRDLYVELPGYGYDKINTAYPYGGPALCVETVGQLTGMPVHHFMEVDFDGFWHVVNLLGGVYYPVDRRYYNPETSVWKSIDIEPGYQRLDGHDALDFVRFRHDARGDFSRMQRQQTFLKELQRQSGRWNKDWKRVAKLLTAITSETTSDLDSLQQLLPLASLALTLDTSDVNTVRLEGGMQMMNGLSYVVASPDEVQAAVAEFADPTQAPVVDRGGSMPKKAYSVRVFNGSGVDGVATAATDQLVGLGYQAEAAGNADSFDYGNSVVYATQGMKDTAAQFVRLLSPAQLRIIPREPGGTDGITVVLGATFDGQINVPEPDEETSAIAVTEGRYDEAGWRALDVLTKIKLQMPEVWGAGLVYDQFRAYDIDTPDGHKAASAVVVGRTPLSGYFSIQVTRWLDPPAIAHPTTKKKIDGTTYLLFYSGADLHMVAWRRGNSLYWVLNTLDDQLSDEFMLALATSFAPMDPPQTGAAPAPDASSTPEVTPSP